MSNITARKGLAFGALVALGSTLLAGAPAHAAAGVTLAPVAGTSLNLPAGYGYELRATASSEIPSDRFAEFKFKVTSVDAAAATVETFDQYGNLWDTDSVDGTAGDSIVLDGFGHSNGYGVNNGSNLYSNLPGYSAPSAAGNFTLDYALEIKFGHLGLMLGGDLRLRSSGA